MFLEDFRIIINDFQTGWIKRNSLYHWGLIVSVYYLLVSSETMLNLGLLLPVIFKIFTFTLLSLHLIISLKFFSFFESLFVFIFILISLIVGIRVDNLYNILSTSLLICGAKTCNFHDIAKTVFKINLFVCLQTVSFCEFGLITNQLVSNSHESLETGSDALRQTFGYYWPTDFASHVFLISLMYSYLRNMHLFKKEIFAFFIICYVVYKLTDARLGCGLMIILLVVNLLCSFRVIKIKTKFVYVLILPFCVIIEFFLVDNFDERGAGWLILNDLFSGRLYITSEALNLYGVNLLGTYLHMVGGGGEGDYNYIDSSYMQLLIIYGLLYSLLFIGSYIFLSYRAYVNKKGSFLFSIVFLSFLGIFAQHLIQVYMAPFILALFSKHRC